MKTMLVAVVGLLLQAAAAKGTISTKDGSMPVVDAVAVWNPAKGELRVALTPFKIQEKHLPDIRKDSTMFAMFGEKSPDPKKWADWCPAAEVKLTLDAREIAKGPASLKSYHFWAYGLKEKNYTHNMNRSGEDAQKEMSKLVVKLDAKGAGTFEMTFAGKSAFDTGMAWDLAVKGSVLTPLEDK
jgi:hypothetical protein